VINAKEAHLFVASGYKGKPSLDFIELYTNTIELYHNSVLNDSVDLTVMEDALSLDYLEQTIFPSVPSAQHKCKTNSVDVEGGAAMLSLAMKSVSNRDAKRKV